MTVQERLNRIEEGATCRHCEERKRRSNPDLSPSLRGMSEAIQKKSGLLRTYLAMTDRKCGMTKDWIALGIIIHCDRDDTRTFLESINIVNDRIK